MRRQAADGRRQGWVVCCLLSAVCCLRRVVCCVLCAVCCLSAGAQTFDEVLRRVNAQHVDDAQIARAGGPTIRLETSTGVSRSQDLFFESPYESRSASAVVSFDYPLFDGTARSIAGRIARNESEQTPAISDADFELLLDAYAELWLASVDRTRARQVSDDVLAIVNRGPELLRKGTISNITAAQWEESALAIRSRVLDLELRKLDAATKLAVFVDGDVKPVIDVSAIPASIDAGAAVEHHPEVIAASRRVERARLAVEQAESRRRPDFGLTGFAGIGAADATFRREQSQGTFGIYGLRFRMSYPLRDGGFASELSRARRELARTERERDAIARRVQTTVAVELLRIDAQRKRIELLTEALDVSNRRQQSLVRLVAAGVQPDVEALRAAAESLAREGRLDEARVEQWKAWQRLRRLQ